MKESYTANDSKDYTCKIMEVNGMDREDTEWDEFITGELFDEEVGQNERPI